MNSSATAPSRQTEQYDAVVIGGGHNGLVCAGYLARAGIKVKLLEKRAVVGGAAVTEEFHPGFRNSVCSYVVSLLHPEVIRDLELSRHGLTILDRPSGYLCLLPGGAALQLPRDIAAAKREIARLSPRDAEAYAKLDEDLCEIGMALRAVMAEPPPNFGGGLADLWQALKLGNKLRALPGRLQAGLAELMTASIGDYVAARFEREELQGALGFEGVIGNFASPYHPGTAYVLLHHMFGEVNGQVAAWGHAVGGMGAITQAMARSAEAQGAAIETSSSVREIIIEGGKAKGAVLEDGRTIRANIVAGNVHPQLLFLKMMDGGLLPDDFRRRITHWRSKSATFRMNLALSELPRFAALGDANNPERMKGSINIAPSLGYLQRAFDDARAMGWSKAPVVSMNIPSVLDDSLAPKGAHVASLFCQHFDFTLPDGRSWDDAKEKAADLIIDTVAEHVPNLKRALVGRQVLSPLDLEREFGLVGGDIFHGAIHLDQIFSLRPAAGYADHRTPIDGLYLCGSGAHPGGGVTGLPGRNAARAILKDRGRSRI
ncbi:MAG TPA: NAD(P)/FAD-dependent oxidoreductase [Alphaproteobacteria bacterium]|nr:NAD(P)/FAD-dependent oxidoreductase [Alphaproteobacteria bacterium]